MVEGSQEGQNLETVALKGLVSRAQWMGEEAKHQQGLIAEQKEKKEELEEDTLTFMAK
jgi:hypothetical protein